MSEIRDIYVSGAIKLHKIIHFQMEHTYDEHATAVIIGWCEKDALLETFDDTMSVYVNVETENETYVAFCGKIQKVNVNMMGQDYSEIQIDLISSSILLDKEPVCRSFQNITDSYQEVAELSCDGKAMVIWEAGKRQQIKKPLIQYYETAWEFVKRINSHFGVKVYSDVTTDKVILQVGYDEKSSSLEMDVISLKKIYSQKYLEKKGQKLDDFICYEVESERNVAVGQTVNLDKKNLIVYKKNAILQESRLIFTYKLGESEFISKSIDYNDNFIGRVIKGEVLSVKNETIRMKMEIDEQQDEAVAYDYPYEPESGNLMYCMPLVGSTVSLYFGSNDERTGRIINCIRMNDESCANIFNPDNKVLNTEYNKQIQLNESSLTLCGNSSVMASQSGSPETFTNKSFNEPDAAGKSSDTQDTGENDNKSNESDTLTVQREVMIGGERIQTEKEVPISDSGTVVLQNEVMIGGEKVTVTKEVPVANLFDITDTSGIYTGTDKSITVVADGVISIQGRKVDILAVESVDCKQGVNEASSDAEPQAYVTVDDTVVQAAGDYVECELLDIYIYPTINDEPQVYQNNMLKKIGIGLGCVLIGAALAVAAVYTGGAALVAAGAIAEGLTASGALTIFGFATISGSAAVGGYALSEAADKGTQEGSATTRDIKRGADYAWTGGVTAFSTGCFSGPGALAAEGSVWAGTAASTTYSILDVNASGLVVGQMTGDGYSASDAVINTIFAGSHGFFEGKYGLPKSDPVYAKLLVNGANTTNRECLRNSTILIKNNLSNGEESVYVENGAISDANKDEVLAEYDESRDQRIHNKSYDNYFISRGAPLKCTCGTHKRLLNIHEDLGFRFMNDDYILPYIGKCQCVKDVNIKYYGVCKNGSGPAAPNIKLYEDGGSDDPKKQNYVEGPKCDIELLENHWFDTYTNIYCNERAGELVCHSSFLVCKHGGFIEVTGFGGYRDADPSQIKKFEYQGLSQEIYDMENKRRCYADYREESN